MHGWTDMGVFISMQSQANITVIYTWRLITLIYRPVGFSMDPDSPLQMKYLKYSTRRILLSSDDSDQECYRAEEVTTCSDSSPPAISNTSSKAKPVAEPTAEVRKDKKGHKQCTAKTQDKQSIQPAQMDGKTEKRPLIDQHEQ